MKNKRLRGIIFLSILITIFLYACFPEIQTFDDTRGVYVENKVSARFLPPHLWAYIGNPDAVPVQSVDNSESKIILPRSLPDSIEAVAMKVKEKIKSMNSNASVDIEGKSIIIRNVYKGDLKNKIQAKNLSMPNELRGMRGVMLLLPETTWATENSYPNPENEGEQTGVNYQVCSLGIIDGVEISLVHGTVGAQFFSNGQGIRADYNHVNNPTLATWKKCKDI